MSNPNPSREAVEAATRNLGWICDVLGYVPAAEFDAYERVLSAHETALERAEADLASAKALLAEAVAVYRSWPDHQPDGETWWQRMADATNAADAFLAGEDQQ